MKKPFLFTAAAVMLAAPAFAQDAAESAVLSYHYKMHKRVDTISPVQRSAKQVSLDSAQSDEDKDLTVTLLPTMFGVRDADKEKIYDMTAKLLYDIDHAAKTVQVIPLHAIVSERKKLRAEMPQLAVNFETYTGTGRFVKTMNGHTLDTKIHMIDLDALYGGLSNMESAKMLALSDRQKTKSFDTSAGTISEYEPADKKMGQTILKSYANFLTYVPTLHPDVEYYLNRNSAPFARLQYKTNTHTGTRTEEEWELKDLKLGKPVTLTPQPEGYTRLFTTDKDLEASFQASQKPGPKAADYAQMIKAHVAEGDSLRAQLKQSEMLMSVPAEDAMTQDNLNFEILKLPDNEMIKNTMKAVKERQTTQNGITLTNEYLKEAKRLYKDYVYFLDIFRARNIRLQAAIDIAAGKSYNEKEFAKALKMYENALAENPWLATAYADLGDAHHEHGNGTFAWTCWLQAVKLKPDLPGKQKIEAMKASIEKDFPEYF